MIPIFRSGYDSKINEFHEKEYVKRSEVVILEKTVFGKKYTYVEPSKKGNWAFGGALLFTSDGCFPEFNTPLKLHDRNMDLES